MCRWLAYSGAPILLEEVLFNPEHSLIDQSLNATDSFRRTNGDGFGIGWYGRRAEPGVYRDIRPAWNDTNLQALAAQIESSMFLLALSFGMEGDVRTGLARMAGLVEQTAAQFSRGTRAIVSEPWSTLE